MSYQHCVYGLVIPLSLALVAGCVPLVVVGGAAATGAMVAHDPRTTGTQVEDESIELKIATRISENGELSVQATHVNATSYDTIVLLSGEVPTEQSKQKVFDIARGTDKVRHVYNHLTVGPPSTFASRSSDTLLTTKVKTQLVRIENFSSDRVKVVTERGIVYLMGLLSQKEGAAVAGMARRVGGVQKVVKLFEYTG